MTTSDLSMLLRGLRRRMWWSSVLRWLVAFSIVLAFTAIGPFGTPEASRNASVWLLLVLGGWLACVAVSVRTAKAGQWASVLFAAGRFEEAEAELVRAIRGFTIFRHTLLAMGQQLGSILHARGAHREARDVFRTVVRAMGRRARAANGFAATLRLLWADCELALGDLRGTYEALHPVYGMPLTLTERLMLLPIELRYGLASGHSDHVVGDLATKLRYAELLESPQAALVHALLAEACRREGMQAEADFLQRRAALYHDLDALPPILNVTGGEPGMTVAG